MPYEEGLPQTNVSQEIGQDATDCLHANRPANWRITSLEGDNDFGFDIQVQIGANNQISHAFRIQLKGTRSPQLSADGSFISIDLFTSTLRYFDNTVEPVLLVVCDLSVRPDDPRDCVLHYVWMRAELDRIQLASIPLCQEKATLRVPTANVIRRSTDLIEDVRKMHRLARLGDVLNSSVASMDPSMGLEERVSMVEAMTDGITTRGPVFAQALASPSDGIWLNPPHGSLPWLLVEAKSALASGNDAKAEGFLGQAMDVLDRASLREQAEYWSLAGRRRLILGDIAGASAAFERAVTLHSDARYWAAWAESQMNRRGPDNLAPDYSAVIESLPASSDPGLLGVKARLLGAARRYSEAIAVLDGFGGSESLAARAVVETAFSHFDRALQACLDGLALNEKQKSTWMLFLILRARARFHIALRNARFDESNDESSEDQVLPPSGPIGVDSQALRLAWDDIGVAVEALEEIRWASNGEFVVDIWVASAGMLGRQREVLPRVLAAARLRPSKAELQSAAETLAAQCGDFKSALEANSRLPLSDMKILRRVVMLHEIDKHRECVDQMSDGINSVSRSHPLFCTALLVAALSADLLAKDDLVDAWRGLLRAGNVDGQAYEAVLVYRLDRRRNQLQNSEALRALVRADEDLGHPRATTLLLFEVLDPEDAVQAEQFSVVTQRVRSMMRLSSLVARRIAEALACQQRWVDLLSLCEEAEREFEVTDRIKAFHALALDQLGRSDDARSLLELMLQQGGDDGLALNTYVNIMVRWGFTEKARDAAELILEKSQSTEQRIECVRMLFNLERQANPTSRRLVDLAFRMGELASPDDEAAEGMFLCMVLGATSFERASLTDERSDEFQLRANAFFENFPQSKILHRVTLPTDASPEELLSRMKLAIGITDEEVKRRSLLQAQLKKGEVAFPFAWRPRIVMGDVQDVVHLWEVSKRSAPDEQHLHLHMIIPRVAVRTRASGAFKPPLIDLLTLLLLEDLDLLDQAFAFYPKIAISQGTLHELMGLSQSFPGSLFWQRCVELQERLRPYLPQILQPRAALPEGQMKTPGSAEELQALARTGNYVVYCDDAILRLWILEGKAGRDEMCTLDLLEQLEEVGALSTDEVTGKLAQLCAWHVGIQIHLKHQIALIPEEVRAESSVSRGAELLLGCERFRSVAASMWGPHSSFESSLNHVSQFVIVCVKDTQLSDVATGAFVAAWLKYAALQPGAAGHPLWMAALVALRSTGSELLTSDEVSRAWGIYLGVAETTAGVTGPKARSAAITLLAHFAARLDLEARASLTGRSARIKKRAAGRSDKGRQSVSLRERLESGLEFNSVDWVRFRSAYLEIGL